MSEAITTAGQSATLHCPKCHTSITYYDVTNSSYFACHNCRSFFKHESDKEPERFGYFKKKADFVEQVLTLGARGCMPDGLTYRVIGYMAKAEKTSINYCWGEYVLFSPPANYAQLAVYAGHWTFIKPDPQQHRVVKISTKHSYVDAPDGSKFDIYNKYRAVVYYAIGEFDWDICADEKLHVAEFVAPPYMLVEEKKTFGKDPHWFRAEHIEPATVAEAFGVPEDKLPERKGIGAVQPAPGNKTWLPLLYTTFLLALLAVATQMYLSNTRPSNKVLAASFVTNPDTARTATAGQSTVLVSPSFEVKQPTALQVEVEADLTNQWLELPVNLVNEQTGQSFEFTKSLERYSGVEDGESWSEGSNSTEAVLSHVPAGRYHLNLYPQTENGQFVSFRVGVRENATLPSNLLLLMVLFAYPVVQYMRRSQHEQQRWASSDYGPE